MTFRPCPLPGTIALRRDHPPMLCLVLPTLLLVSLPAQARPIPPGSEARVLALLEPYGVDAPGDRIREDVLIDAVSIEHERIRITLKRAHASVDLLMAEKDSLPENRVMSTASFDLSLAAETGDPELRAAVRTLVLAIDGNDRRDFWGGLDAAALVFRAPEGTEVPPPAGFQWYDFIGEAFLLALLAGLVLVRRALCVVVAPVSGWQWAGVAACALVAAVFRLVPLGSEEGRDSGVPPGCSSGIQCNDFNPCTRDLCVEQSCRSVWEPPAGLACCRGDVDCPPSEVHCHEAYCEESTHLCALRGMASCNVEPYPALSRPSLESSVGWLLAVPAKYVADTTALATWTNRVCAVLAVLLLFLVGRSWGGSPGTALGAAFLMAVLPAALPVAATASMVGLVLLLALLALLFAALLLLPSLNGTERWSLLALTGLSFFFAACARAEMLLLAVPTGLLVLSRRRAAGIPLAQLFALLAVFALAAASRLALVPPEASGAAYPPLLQAPRGQGIYDNLERLLAMGIPIPFFLVLMALAGLWYLRPAARALFWLCLFWLPLLLAPLFLFQLNPSELLRWTLIPTLGLLLPAGESLRRLATLKIRGAWLAAAVLVLYFLLFPWTHIDELRRFLGAPDISSLFFEL